MASELHRGEASRRAWWPSLAHEITVWLASSEVADGVVQECTALLDSDERAQAARFHRDSDRALYTVAHALVRTTLSRYGPLGPAEWRFRANEFGRPEIANREAPPGLRFNLSHTPGLLACAVNRTLDMGVDVERIRPVEDLLRLADHALAPSECAELRRVTAPEQPERFFRYWTLKEAYLKARGLGLSLPTRDFSYRFVGDRIDVAFGASVGDDASQWRFFAARPTREHALALAVRCGRAEMSIETRWTDPLGGLEDRGPRS